MLRRFSVFSLAFLLCLSLFPARALADVGNASVLWSGSINDGTQFGAFVKGGSRYDAAAASLGYDPSRFSDEVKAKLSDSRYGGMFYTFANAFSSVSSPIEIPSWVPVFVTTSSVIADLLNNISGDNYPHWSVAVAYSVYDLALRDLLVVLNGGDVGGGGTIDEGSFDGVYLNAFNNNKSSGYSSYVAYNASFDDGVVTLTGGESYYSGYLNSRYYVADMRIYVSVAVLRFANALIADGYRVAFAVSPASINTSDIMLVYSPDLSVNYQVTSDSNYSSYVFLGSDIKFVLPDDYGKVCYSSDGFFSVAYDVPSNASAQSLPSGIGVSFMSSVFSSPFDLPSLPSDGDWPEYPEPASPAAPELPEPATPTVETPVIPTVPAPVWPDITINIDNDPTPGTTPSGLDYTELLTRINDNLISIDAFARAINSNLNSLRSDLLAEFNGVIDSLRNIYNYLLTIDSVLETHCTHLRNKIEQSAVFIANYMRTLIKWLADQLDFDDLTNVEAPDNSLLTTINEKLGGGTYEPNPIKDEQGYYEWLDDLWDRFLLGDNWQSSMGSISGSFSELKTRFPFSVPWDIVALFRLFVHDPVTPVFDLPLYFSPDGSTPVHVDLSPWDSVASLVRPMVFVIFALKLALLSRDLLGGLGADKGGL